MTSWISIPTPPIPRIHYNDPQTWYCSAAVFLKQESYHAARAGLKLICSSGCPPTQDSLAASSQVPELQVCMPELVEAKHSTSTQKHRTTATPKPDTSETFRSYDWSPTVCLTPRASIAGRSGRWTAHCCFWLSGMHCEELLLQNCVERAASCG